MEKIFNFVKSILGFAKETTTKPISIEVPKETKTFVKIEEPIKVEEPIVVEEPKPVVVNETKPKTPYRKPKKKTSTKK